jgi:phospholipid transport system substrate-binding protein
MHNKSSLMSRRRFAAGFALGSVALALPMPVAALTVDQARGLIDKVVADINGIIASGKAEGAMLKDFERMFARYADVAVISRSALGVAAKSASPAQLQAFAGAFQTYISAKYGRRFREFIGGTITVIDAKPVKSYYEVISVAQLAGEAPFDLRWHVSDKSGKNLFFNIIIEGINLLASERSEIGAMLDQAGGNIDTLIANMKAV